MDFRIDLNNDSTPQWYHVILYLTELVFISMTDGSAQTIFLMLSGLPDDHVLYLIKEVTCHNRYFVDFENFNKH